LEGKAIAVIDEIKIVVKTEVDAAMAKMAALDRKMQEQQVSARALGKEFVAGLVPGIMAFAGPLGAAALAAEGINRIVQYTKECITEFEEAEQITKKLEAIIRATGGAAGLTAREMEDYADAASIATGYEADAIKNLQAVMATFKSITGDSFKRATSDALDMAAAFGGDLQSAAIQLGKALETPSVGLTALRRIGVTFSEQQIEQIKNFEEANNLAGAQAIIFEGLESQVKGVAVAMQDSSSGAHKALINATKELKEEQGKSIANGMRPYWEWLTKIKIQQKESIQSENNLADAMAGRSADLEKAIQAIQKNLDAWNNSADGVILKETTLSTVYTNQIEALKLRLYWMNEINKMQDSDSGDVGAGKPKAKPAPLPKEAEEVKKDLDKVLTYKEREVEAMEALRQWEFASARELSEKAAETEMEGYDKMLKDREEAYKKYHTGLAEAEAKAAADQIAKQEEVARVIAGVMTDSFELLGEALAGSEDGWKKWQAAGIKAIADILEKWATAQIAMGIANLFDPLTAVKGLGQIAGGVAGGIGAGILNQAANDLVQTRSTTTNTSVASNTGPTYVVTQNVAGSVISQAELGNFAAQATATASRGY